MSAPRDPKLEEGTEHNPRSNNGPSELFGWLLKGNEVIIQKASKYTFEAKICVFISYVTFFANS